jgi:L-alanine-DL-glutamate epimerase-like enolase superfamily enzyme
MSLRFETVDVGGSIPTSFGNARGEWEERHGLVVKVVDENGLVGCGEASPLPGYSAHTLASVGRALTPLTAAPLPEPPPTGVPLAPWIASITDRLGEPCASAVFAVETALLDLVGRRRKRSMATLLREDLDRETAVTPGPVHDVLVSWVLGREPSRWVQEVARLESDGVLLVKCKIGRNIDLELRFLAELRERFPLLGLRLDANGTLPADRLDLLFPRFRELGVELVEEPVRDRALFALPKLAVPHAVDESLVGGIEQALASEAAVFVLKPALHGLLATRALALSAHAHGKRVFLTHLFDGPWALAAAAELALALPFPLLPCGLAEHAALSAYPLRRQPRLGAGPSRLDRRATVHGHGVWAP